MPCTGRHSYFNISNSNYKRLIDPQRGVEITGWNRAPTTQSAAMDHSRHRSNKREENKQTPQITLLNQQIKEDFDIP